MVQSAGTFALIDSHQASSSFTVGLPLTRTILALPPPGKQPVCSPPSCLWQAACLNQCCLPFDPSFLQRVSLSTVGLSLNQGRLPI